MSLFSLVCGKLKNCSISEFYIKKTMKYICIYIFHSFIFIYNPNPIYISTNNQNHVITAYQQKCYYCLSTKIRIFLLVYSFKNAFLYPLGDGGLAHSFPAVNKGGD